MGTLFGPVASPCQTRIAELISNPQMWVMAGQRNTAGAVQLGSPFHSSKGLSDSFMASDKVAITKNTLVFFKRHFAGVQRVPR